MLHYTADTIVTVPEFRVEFRRQSLRPMQVACRPQRPVTLVEVGTGLDMDSLPVQLLLGKVMMKVALALAPEILLPLGREIAAGLGVAPASWRIYSGRRVLGSCTSRGEVALSAACVFLPDRLRRFVVCHELAHLSQMNHSAAFHSLCDSYLGGSERDMIRELRNFDWPLPPRVVKRRRR